MDDKKVEENEVGDVDVSTEGGPPQSMRLMADFVEKTRVCSENEEQQRRVGFVLFEEPYDEWYLFCHFFQHSKNGPAYLINPEGSTVLEGIFERDEIEGRVVVRKPFTNLFMDSPPVFFGALTAYSEDGALVIVTNCEKSIPNQRCIPKDYPVSHHMHYFHYANGDEFRVYHSNTKPEPILNILDFSKYPCLEHLVIGSFLFARIRHVFLFGMPNLETFQVGKQSFTESHFCYVWDYFDFPFEEEHYMRIKSQQRKLILMSLPKLSTIEIGQRSFADFTTFLIDDCSRLASVSLGDDANLNGSYSFYQCNEWILHNLPSLQSLVIKGSSVFSECSSFKLSNLPQFVSMYIDSRNCFPKCGPLPQSIHISNLPLFDISMCTMGSRTQ